MNPLSVFVITAYVLSLILRWYKNTWIVMLNSDLPAVIRSPNRRFVLFATGAVLTYSSLIGLWWLYGITVAIVGFVVNVIVARISFARHLDREIRQQAEWEYRQMLAEKTRATDNTTPGATESQMRQEASERARKMVQWRLSR